MHLQAIFEQFKELYVWKFGIHCVHKKSSTLLIPQYLPQIFNKLKKSRSVLKSAGSEDFKTDLTFVFWQWLPQIFTKFKKEGQFWNLLVLSFSKLTLLLIFGQVEAEKIEVKDVRGHFHFSHEYVNFYSVSAAVITLLDF